MPFNTSSGIEILHALGIGEVKLLLNLTFSLFVIPVVFVFCKLYNDNYGKFDFDPICKHIPRGQFLEARRNTEMQVIIII